MQKVLHKDEEFMPFWVADLGKLYKSLNPISSSVETATAKMHVNDKWTTLSIRYIIEGGSD